MLFNGKTKTMLFVLIKSSIISKGDKSNHKLTFRYNLNAKEIEIEKVEEKPKINNQPNYRFASFLSFMYHTEHKVYHIMVIECSKNIESRNERMTKLVNCYSNFKLVHSIAIAN